MLTRVQVVSIKAGMPTIEEARARLKAEIGRAKAEGTIVLKLIHGYGSGGVGGSLKPAILSSLRRRKKDGLIRAFVPGEKWELFNDTAQQILQECPELSADQDLNHYNEGITLVLL